MNERQLKQLLRKVLPSIVGMSIVEAFTTLRSNIIRMNIVRDGFSNLSNEETCNPNVVNVSVRNGKVVRAAGRNDVWTMVCNLPERT